jgi:hypothetical protein
MSARCLGIHVKDSPEGLLSFEGGAGKFHIPYRCDRVAAGSKGLCSACCAKEERTAAKVAQMKPGNTTIGGQLPSFLNGRVGEPIPFWTRLYDGAWYRLKVEGGATLSEATMGRVKKAVAEAYQGEAQPPPAPLPDGKGARQGRKKKEVVAAPSVAAVAPTPASPTVMEALAEAAAKVPAPAMAPAPVAAVPTPVPAVATSTANTPAAKPVKKTPAAAKKKTVAAPAPSSDAPVARISTESEPTPVEDVVTATVKKTELAGRSVYLEAQKGKVYDLKFHYLGRWDSKKEKIVAHPDSDAEC